MAKLFVYDGYTDRFLVYPSLKESDPMPYATGGTLTVREFRGKKRSNGWE